MKKIRPTEAQLQRGLVQWLNRANWVGSFFSVPNEGGYKNKGLQEMGLMPGVGDLVFWGMPDCPLAFVELKRQGGKLSKEQEYFQSLATGFNTPYELIASDDINFFIDTMTGLLRGWGAMR